MAHDVFISYSSKDKAVADAVCATLEARKIRCWIAPRDVLPGMPYGQALSDALHASRVMVVVLSSNSNASQQVMREVEAAVDRGITIVPLRIEDVQPSGSMEFFLKAIHWLDALTPPLEQHLQKLAESIQRLLESSSPAPDVARSRFAMPASQSQHSDRRRRLVRIVALGIVGVLVATAAAAVAWQTFRTPPPGTEPVTVASPATAATRRDDTRKTTELEPPAAEVTPEVAVRKAIERFYDLLSKKDEAGMEALQPANDSAKLVAGRREAMHNIVTETGKITVDQLVIDRIRVDGNRATAHATVLLTAPSLKTGKPYFSDKLIEFNWELIKEGSAWKIGTFNVVPNEDAVAAIRGLIKKYYDLLAKKDMDGIVALYAKQTTLGTATSRQEAMKGLFDETGPITVKSLKFGRMTVLGDGAAVYVYVQLEAMNVKTGRPYFPDKPMTQDWSLVREADGWKLEQFKTEVD
jgi:ketosteroid isomerase-like protein